MKTGFEVGVRVTGGKPGWISLGTLVAGKNEFGWVNPCYSGEGWYFVRWENDHRVMVVHEDDLQLAVMRYVITNIDKKGELRVLTLSGQGTDTFGTKLEAETRMRILEPQLRAKVLGDRADTLEVTEVECWPGHFDPKRTVWGLPGDCD